MLVEILKVLTLVPAVIFLFYSAVYLILYELDVQPQLKKFYRNISLVLSGGAILLISLYLII